MPEDSHRLGRALEAWGEFKWSVWTRPLGNYVPSLTEILAVFSERPTANQRRPLDLRCGSAYLWRNHNNNKHGGGGIGEGDLVFMVVIVGCLSCLCMAMMMMMRINNQERCLVGISMQQTA
jgi:hypothetical protein